MARCLTIFCTLLILIGPLSAESVENKAAHWAWKAPSRPEIPPVADAAWARNPIDRFILARLESSGLHPALRASRPVLLRRASFDLIGLPPTEREIDAFVNDPSPNAWEKVIDRLLASPHYGERWGRHWLDLVRFADSNGYEFDEARPDAWRYRDYVIRSFNGDKPYDRFVREQLAGDELYPNDVDALIATGFHLLGPDMTDSSDQKQRRQNTLNDMTDTTASVFLGLTLACARCHDHKFEPIPQADYYRFQAFFTPAIFRRDLPISTSAERRAYQVQLEKYNFLVRPIETQISKLETPHQKRLYRAKLARLSEEAQQAHQTPAEQRSPPQRSLVEKTSRLLQVAPQEIRQAMTREDRARRDALEAARKEFEPDRPKPLPVAMGVQTGPNPAKAFLLRRGELTNPGEAVQPGFPGVLTSSIGFTTSGAGGSRSCLADWLAQPGHPLTSRVLVNRLWQHHFGRGIVATASDFGVHGEAPTHPELLDFLASEFATSGWSIKRMHRLILTAAVYQQSSNPEPEALAKDPSNQLFSRMTRTRLEGELLRDSMLAVSGGLERRMGGPGVFPPRPPEAPVDVRVWPAGTAPGDRGRRSIYIFARRNLRFPFLETFDLPDSTLSCPKREQSTTAPQALTLLNSSDALEAAARLARQVAANTEDQTQAIRYAYRRILGRLPSPAEDTLARRFLEHSPLKEFCRALLNVNEFVYID